MGNTLLAAPQSTISILDTAVPLQEPTELACHTPPNLEKR